jgi:L-fuculose-phosphate aldolase
MGENRAPLQFNDIPFDFGAVGDARPLEVRAALTACAWILADENHESGLAGQITARGPQPDTYWTLPLGLGFDEAVPDEEARAARDFLRRDGIVLQTFNYWMRRTRRRRGLT